MKKRFGFTLVELLVAVAIGAVLVSVGAFSVNRFYAQQKVNNAVNDINNVVKLAQNYAQTMQLPSGDYAKPVEYIAVIIGSNGVASVVPGNNANGLDIGSSYTSKLLNTQDIVFSPLNPGDLMFAVPEGKLLQFNDQSQTTTAPLSTYSSVDIIVSSIQDASLKNGLLVLASGLIEETAYDQGLVPTDAFTNGMLTPTPDCSIVCGPSDYSAASAACTANHCISDCGTHPGICKHCSTSKDNTCTKAVCYKFQSCNTY